MSKSPSFNFYSADFLVGVSDLTMAERGQYITLLCLQHQKGRLSLKSIEIALGTVSDDVLAKFEIDENGCYYNKRLEAEKIKKDAYVENRLKNLSNSKCANSHMESHMSDHTESHMEIEIENENINDNKNNIDIDNNLYFQWFNELWELYPKKRDKDRAQKTFMRIKPSAELFAQMKSALEKQKRSKQWQDNQYIPYPSTWLRGKRWEDEVSERDCSSFDVKEAYKIALNRKYPSKEKEEKESSFDTDDFFEANLKRSYGK